MVRYELIKFNQKSETFYFLHADPRIIVDYCKYAPAKTLQENQRPWDVNRVKEIAKYVAGKKDLNETDYQSPREEHMAMGLIPNCPLLNLKENRIIDDGRSCYLDLPDSPEQIIEILDGQHRLIAFSDSYLQLDPDETYEMGFILCNQLNVEKKKELFMVPNQTQKVVEKGVLLAMMDELGLFNSKNEEYYAIIEMLNDEDKSPYRGRIKIGGSSIKNGLNPDALMKIFEKSRFIDRLTGKNASVAEKFERLIVYLNAWAEVYPDMKKTTHTLSKIQGIRFMMMIGPSIVDIVQSQGTGKWNVNNIAEILKVLNAEIIVPEGIFDRRSGKSNPFSSQSSVEAMAYNFGLRLKETYSNRSNDIFEK